MIQTSQASLRSAPFDTGPLSWVINEIRDALERSAKALQEAAGRSPEARPTLLLHAKSHLHQAHGALQMVDVHGVERLTDAAEQAIDRFKEGNPALTKEHAAVVAEAYGALVEFLQELLDAPSGAPQPARLFPYYRALQEAMGAERVHPGDLLVLNPAASRRLDLPAGEAADIAACRARFEKALLPFLKSHDAAARREQAGAMRDALAPIVGAQSEARPLAFWLGLHTVADLVAQGQLDDDIYLKQLFGQVNLQLRRMAQGHTSLPEPVLRDALFFIAQADAPTPDAVRLRDAWGVEGRVPRDYLERRYGRIDGAALKDAKTALAEAKAAWDRLAGVEAGQADVAAAAAAQGEFDAALARLAGAGDRLDTPPLAQLLHELGPAAGSAALARSDAFGLEMAEALLFVEHGLDQIRQLPADFDAHAGAIGERLRALAHGETAPATPQWQGGLRRDDTGAALAGELRTGLRQVEKLIDEYNDDPGRRAALDAADPLLHQLHGVLSILDQPQAARTVAHVRGAARALADGAPDAIARAAALDNLAQNVGALGFFTDALARNAEQARGRFRFDAQAGLLRARPFEADDGADVAAGDAAGVTDTSPEAAPDAQPVSTEPMIAGAAPALAADDTGDAVEAELLEIFIGEAQEVLATVGDLLPAARANPAGQDVLTRIRRGFHTLKGSGRMVGLEQFAGAAAAVEKCMNVWLAESRPATSDLLALLARAHDELSAWVDEMALDGRSARSGDALAAAAARVQAGEALAMEAAPSDDAMPAAPVDLPAEPIVQNAGDAFLADDALDIAPPLDVSAQPPAEPALGPAVPNAAEMHDAIEASEIAAALDAAVAIDITSPTETGSSDAAAETSPQAVDDNVKRIGGLEIPLPLYHIYLAETEDLLRTLTADFSDWRDQPLRAVSAQALKAAHTLGGTSATVGFRALQEIAFTLEDALRVATPPLDDGQHALLDETLERVRIMLQVFALGELPPPQPELLARLAALRDDMGRKKADAVFGDDDAELSARLDDLFAGAYASILADPPLAGAPMPTPADAGPAPRLSVVSDAGASDVDDLFDAYFDAAPAAPEAPAIQQPAEPARTATAVATDATDGFDMDALFDLAPPQAAVLDDARNDALADTLADTPDVDAPFYRAPPVDAQADAVPAFDPDDLALPELGDAPVRDAGDAESEFAPPAEASGVVAPVGPESEPRPAPQGHDATQPAASAAEAPQPVGPHGSAAPAADADMAGEPVFADELDPDLLPVFMEEATDLLPRIGNGLRQWQHAARSGSPDAGASDGAVVQGLLRDLHTIKGSARMAGAMRLGHHTHALETQIETMLHAGTVGQAAFDELFTSYDQAMLLFEGLQRPAPADAAAPPMPNAEPAPLQAQAGTLPAAPGDDGQARGPLVRVRADILDRLVNQAGEVSIARSRLENQVGVLKGALHDFSDNLANLRRQLREVEMQAETQIASRLSIAGEREFDPLEFDRFTRLQELTRMMAESVNDVASLHDSLARTVDGASEDLAAQSRLTRELQHDLMRVRMVPFASLSERLYRVARQTAKETDKRVNLDIRGGAVEVDRSVLERMAAPFEHLLRNAIVHGIEPRARRVEAGKPETGELLVEVSQHGNEVELCFTDDGAGLDLARIRAKAHAQGLLADGEDASDKDAAELIFEPGFSTADTLTELAGRGVGMDVVRSEARALGGRVDIDTRPGQGVAFTIHLPLTLGVTQIVLVASGARTHAVPANLVEQVLQVRDAELAAAREAGHLTVQGEALALHTLPDLLREPGGAGGQRSYPVLLMKTGAGRIAVQVDEVVGNREVVIKNIGPQLARLPGIVGASVLGSGDIVLILDPVVLAAHAGRQASPLDSLPRSQGTMDPIEAAGRRQAPMLMVVDDSLTVRKVTQRLLEREGYRVLLAKDGVDALEQMQVARPDLMLVDIEMPRMDGFDLTRQVRGDEATHGIPIIMITSRTADKHRNYALGLGVDAYFGKPFQEDVLLAAIAGLLGRPM